MDFKYTYRLKVLCLVICDILLINLVSFIALYFRFDLHFDNIPDEYLNYFLYYAPINTVVSMIVYYFARLYRSLWRYVSFRELLYIILANGLLFILRMAALPFLPERFPMGFYFIEAAMMTILMVMERFSYRGLRYMSMQYSKKKYVHRTKVLIIGAGAAGRTLIREIHDTESLNYNIVGVIDDNATYLNRYIEGTQVLGDRNKIVEIAKEYEIEEIILAIPSAPPEQKKDILDICKNTACTLRTIPGIYQLVNGDLMVSKIRKVDIEDLLGREPIVVDMKEIWSYITDKVILVTGGGGSIGSELCRQIAKHSPKQLVILDIYENSTYDIQNELRRKYPELNLVTLIGSVRNTNRINSVIEKYRPDIIYHAAAHKHVPLMEDSPNEAIKNNVFGTYKTAQAAIKYGVKRFVLISTDKAVNPTNVMGASKRICEMIIQTLNKKGVTEFTAVRFGNVLGSNGSVIPLFKKQIEEGGPVTVTHPDIIRYFMTIPEAVSLVLQASVLAKGGEIFILDMGEPVRIDDLARNLIRLSGYTPDVDIRVKYTGLRPGEKLYEELLMAEEGKKTTKNKRIFIGKQIEVDEEKFIGQLDMLKEAVYNEDDNIRVLIKQVVKEFHPENKKDENQKQLNLDIDMNQDI